MKKLVLLRHGESQWNLENRFTGWTNVDLTEKGEEEARKAGQLLNQEAIKFNVVHTSLLKRANRTMEICIDEMGLSNVSKKFDWRLNERHYGSLQGLNKAETAEKHGDEQVLVWRRSYDIPPPPMSKEDEGYAGKDRRYNNLDESNIPLTECLEDTVARFLPLWEETIAPQIKAGKNVLIAAHGNSLRALIKYLDGVSQEEIIGMNVPTGMPLVYDLDENLKPTNRQYQAVMQDLKNPNYANPSHFKGARRPVEKVSWNDAQVFIERLNEYASSKKILPLGWHFCLPTESEWEYACRAGTTTAYSWGDSIIASNANYSSSGIGQTRDVGQYAANPWGFFDMHGNVWEWTADWYQAAYPTGNPVVNPTGPASGSTRVERGGSWGDVGTE